MNTPRRTRWTSAVSAWRTADASASLQGWRSETSHPWLVALLNNSCHYFGNALGPEYNAAHANHFHFGMPRQGFCF
ncbi:putative inner membrane protein [Klebsiella pneumoniae]|uniref:Putative inner membrane protein n=1 Tax=Klebsiella pneumoniae TaxID=573 RepID=A0A3S4GRJ9_KLEPN|nr:putative inner membrane protein [Klebsiella pneumoniae]